MKATLQSKCCRIAGLLLLGCTILQARKYTASSPSKPAQTHRRRVRHTAGTCVSGTRPILNVRGHNMNHGRYHKQGSWHSRYASWIVGPREGVDGEVEAAAASTSPTRARAPTSSCANVTFNSWNFLALGMPKPLCLGIVLRQRYTQHFSAQ